MANRFSFPGSAKRDLTALLLLAFLASPLCAQTRSLHVEDLTWTEVRDAIAAGKTTAIYYAGSTEQNGPHMALGKHSFIARQVAQRIAAALDNALVYPIMPFAPTGDPLNMTDHMRFPGSISVSEETFASVARDVSLSAIAAGFRNIVLMGDHGGGQEALARVARELTSQWRAEGVHVHYIPDLYYKSNDLASAYLARQGMQPGSHAGLSDTAELMALDPQGRWIRRDRLAAGTAGSGVDGDPRQASAELGERLIGFKVDSSVAQIRGLLSQAH